MGADHRDHDGALGEKQVGREEKGSDLRNQIADNDKVRRARENGVAEHNHGYDNASLCPEDSLSHLLVRILIHDTTRTDNYILRIASYHSHDEQKADAWNQGTLQLGQYYSSGPD